MQFMYEHEMDALLLHNQQPVSKECVICIIQALTDFVDSDRALSMNCDEQQIHENNEEEEEESSQSSLSSLSCSGLYSGNEVFLYGRSATVDRVYQLFRNPKDQAGGFYGDYCLADPDACDVFIDPVVTLNQSVCFMDIDKQNNRAYLDISAMFWQPNATKEQHVGERLSVFCEGVEHN